MGTVLVADFHSTTLSSLLRIAHLFAANHLCARRLLDIAWQYHHEEWAEGSDCHSTLATEVPKLCQELRKIGEKFLEKSEVVFEKETEGQRRSNRTLVSLHPPKDFASYVWTELCLLALAPHSELLQDLAKAQPMKFDWSESNWMAILRSEQDTSV